jgi:hypothetical protein
MRVVIPTSALIFYMFTIINIFFGNGNNKFDYFTVGLLLHILTYIRKEG